MKKVANDICGFSAAIGCKAQGYKAHIQMIDGRVGITAEYTLGTLQNMVIPDVLEASPGARLLKIVKA